MPSVTRIFSIEIMSANLKEIKYHLKQSYHKQKSYPIPYPTLPLTYPTSYPTLYPTLLYPLHPNLPPTIPYPLPYPALSLPYPTLNQPVNLPSMYLSHARYSLISFSVFSSYQLIQNLILALVAQSVERPLRGMGGHRFDPGP